MTKFRNFKRLFYNVYVDMFSESFVVLIIDGAALGIFCKWIWPTEKPRLLTLFTFSTAHYLDDGVKLRSKARQSLKLGSKARLSALKFNRYRKTKKSTHLA